MLTLLGLIIIKAVELLEEADEKFEYPVNGA